MASLSEVGGKLQIKHNGVEYLLDGANLTKGGSVHTKATPEIAEAALEAAKKSNVSPEVRKLLSETATADALKGLGADHAVVNEVSKAAALAESITAKAGATTFATDKTAVKEVRGLLIAGGPLAEKMLEKSTETALAGVKNFYPKMATTKKAYDEFKALLDAEKVDAAAIEDNVLKNLKKMPELTEILKAQESSTYVTTDLVKKGVDLGVVEKGIKKAIKKGAEEATKAANEVVTQKEALNTLKGGKYTATELKDAEAAVLKSEKALEDSLKGKYSKHVFEALNDTEAALVNKVRGYSKNIDNHVKTIEESIKANSSPAAKAAEKSGSIFFKGKEALETLAKEKGVAVSELKTWAKMNTASRVGAIVVPLGIVAYLAGVGKKGKAAEINQDQPQPLLQQAGADQVPARA